MGQTRIMYIIVYTEVCVTCSAVINPDYHTETNTNWYRIVRTPAMHTAFSYRFTPSFLPLSSILHFILPSFHSFFLHSFFLPSSSCKTPTIHINNVEIGGADPSRPGYDPEHFLGLVSVEEWIKVLDPIVMY